MFSNKPNYKIINFAALMLLFYMGFSNLEVWFQLIKSIFSLFLPFILSFFLAYFLYPLVKILQKKGMSKPLAITIVIIGFSLSLFCILSIVFPIIYDQLILFSKEIISIIDQIGDKFNLSLGTIELELEDFLKTLLKYLSSGVSKGTIHFMNKSIDFVSKFIISYISGIYFLYDMNKIRKKVKCLTKKISEKFYQYLKCLDIEISHYVKGLSITMFVQLIEYSFLFFIVGHPNWLLLGILASVTTIIPYFGGIFTNIIGLALATTISTKVLIGTTIVCVLFPVVDSYLISPKIYGKTNEINPLITIVIITIGGNLLGITGIIFSLPIYLLGRTTYLFLKKGMKKEIEKITSNI